MTTTTMKTQTMEWRRHLVGSGVGRGGSCSRGSGKSEGCGGIAVNGAGVAVTAAQTATDTATAGRLVKSRCELRIIGETEATNVLRREVPQLLPLLLRRLK